MDAEANAEAIIEGAGNLVRVVGSFALNPEQDELEGTRRALSDFTDLTDQAAEILKRNRAGQPHLCYARART